jgi:hypothetical protein
MEQRDALIILVDALCAHQGVTHYAISMRAMRKGDFFQKIKERGADCQTKTASRLIGWFSDNWPDDLEWPSNIPRPPKSKREAA